MITIAFKNLLFIQVQGNKENSAIFCCVGLLFHSVVMMVRCTMPTAAPCVLCLSSGTPISLQVIKGLRSFDNQLTDFFLLFFPFPYLPISSVAMTSSVKKANQEQQGSCCGVVSRLIKYLPFLTVLLALFVGFDQIMHKFYIFDQNMLQQVALRNMELYGNDTHAMITNIAADLDKEYPGHIRLKEEWVFNNAGGAMGSMWILHGSLTEYVIIFGTPVGTEGHTGRFLADDYFIILEGEQWAYAAGELTREVRIGKYLESKYNGWDH